MTVDYHLSISEFQDKTPLELTELFLKHRALRVRMRDHVYTMEYTPSLYFKLNTRHPLIAFRHLKVIPAGYRDEDEGEVFQELDKNPISPLDVKTAVRRFTSYVNTRKAGKKSKVKHITQEELAILA